MSASRPGRRRGGLSHDERQCLQRAPVPSEALAADLRRWQDGESISGIQRLLAPAKKTTKLALPRNSRRGAPCEESMAAELSEVELVEERCADILRRLWPAPEARQPVPQPQEKRPISSLSNASLQPGRHRSIAPKEMPTREPKEAQQLRLLQESRVWDSEAFPISTNAITLVKGATANRVERELGGQMVFVHSGPSASGPGQSKKSSKKTDPAGEKAERRTIRKKVTDGHPLHKFRAKLLHGYGSLEEAFYRIDVGLPKDLTSRLSAHEWAISLAGQGLVTQYEARVIYELLDADKDGHLSLREFHLGIETISPVQDPESLRKRLLCLGFPSMMMALSAMHGNGETDTTMIPLGRQQIADALSQAWIILPSEHEAVFNAICDLHAPFHNATLSELLCGLAAVSPNLFLEELRTTCIRRHGSIEAALEALRRATIAASKLPETHTRDNQLCVEPKMLQAELGMSDGDVEYLMPLLDVDGSGDTTLAELMAALALAEPSIALEDLRKKLQISYRSAESVFRRALPGAEEMLEDDSLHFSKDELLLMLEPVEGVDVTEWGRIIDFIASCSATHGSLSVSGFLRGIRLFAPCCVLEEIRLQLLSKHQHLGDAFRQVPDRRAPLDKESFGSALKEAGINAPPAELDAIFGLLDVRRTGVVTIAEFVVMMQCSQQKGQPWRMPEELSKQAETQVRQELAPVHGSMVELKERLRMSPQRACQPSVSFYGYGTLRESTGFPTLGKSASVPARLTLGNSTNGQGPGRMGVSNAAGRSMKVDKLPLARQTFQKITSTLSRVPCGSDGQIDCIREEIGNYFESSQRVLGPQKKLLSQPLLGQVEEYSKAKELRRKAE